MADAGNHVKIAEVGPGFFWTRQRALALSVEDHAAIRSGHANEDQCKRLSEAYEAARNNLFSMPCGEPVYRIEELKAAANAHCQ